MIEIRSTRAFSEWLGDLGDLSARARILVRLRRAEAGNLGDVRSVGDGVSEMRIDYGPGYRIYFARRGEKLIVLLCGGDKRRQQADIRDAKRMAEDL